MDIEKMEQIIDIVDNQNIKDEKNLHNIEETETGYISSNSDIETSSGGKDTTNNSNNKPLTSRQISNNNLVPFNNVSHEEAVRRGSLGGKKSGEVRKKRKQASQLLSEILARSLTQDQINEILGEAATLLGGDSSAYNVMLVKALQCAMSGDIKAMAFIRDTSGDKPIEQVQTEVLTEADKKGIEAMKKRLLG